MINQDKEYTLKRTARRISNNDSFMGSILRAYFGGEIDFDKSAKELNCSIESLIKLSLCTTPRRSPEFFISDVQKISEHTGINKTLIANIIRTIDSINSLRGMPEEHGDKLLLAARDQIKPNKDL